MPSNPVPRPRSLSRFLTVLAVSLGATAPLSAGAVYVAYVTDQVIDGVAYETVLEVSNPTDVPRSLAAHFVPSFTNGVQRPPSPGPVTQMVPPGRTLVLEGFAPPGGRGLLELDGDPELVISATLVPGADRLGVAGAAVPVISSRNRSAPGRRFSVQGLRRAPGIESLFGLVNLAHQPTRCDVDLVGSDGVPRIQTARLDLHPLSAQHWEDVLGLVGIETASGIRAEVVCNGPAYGFGMVFDRDRAAATTLDQAQTTDSTLLAPGREAQCPSGGSCFGFPGIVHQPTRGNETTTLRLDLPEGSVFSAVRLRMTVDLGRWNGPSGAIHNFFWLYRNRWSSNTFGYVQVRGPELNKVAFQTNVDLPNGQLMTARIDQALPAGRTYRVDYVYDTARGVAELVILDEQGAEVARLSSPTTTARVRQEGDAFFVQLGLREQHFEVPSYGWTYRDLRVDFVP